MSFALVLVLVFKGRVYFYWLELVKLFRLYLDASLCTWDIHVRGSISF